MAIRAVLFDKDGTLIDFDRTWAPTFHALIAEVTRSDAPLMRALSESCGYDLDRRAFAPDSLVVAGSNADFTESWASILGVADAGALLSYVDGALARLSIAHVSPFDDLAESLERLARAGFLLGVATNDAEASARAQLDALGITARFAHVFGYDSGHGAKPGPGMVRAFCEAVRLPPAEIVMVGDSLHDMHAGRAAGTRTLALTTGTISRFELEPHADHVADSLSLGCDWIEAQAMAHGKPAQAI